MNDEGLYGFGQLAAILRARYCDPKIASINKTDGLTFKVKEILDRVFEGVFTGLESTATEPSPSPRHALSRDFANVITPTIPRRPARITNRRSRANQDSPPVRANNSHRIPN